MKMFKGSNSHGRRKYRRLMARLGSDTKMVVTPPPPPAFEAGQEVKIIAEAYGKSYLNTKAVVIGPGAGGLWLVQSKRRKSPLEVAAAHIVKKAA